MVNNKAATKSSVFDMTPIYLKPHLSDIVLPLSLGAGGGSKSSILSSIPLRKKITWGYLLITAFSRPVPWDCEMLASGLGAAVCI